MIRPTLAALVALALATPVLAQGRGLIGVRGGVSVASISGLDDTFDDDNTTGSAWGAFLRLGSGVIALQPELNYTSKGFSFVIDDPDRDDIELRYLQPAVVVKAGIPLGPVRPSVLAGVGYGMEVDCQFAGSDCDDVGAEFTDTKNEWAGIFGVDLEIGLGGIVLIGDARYEVGLNSINDSDDVFDDLKNRAWILRAGVGIPF